MYSLEKFGWKRSDGKLEVIWEVPENIAKVQQRIQYTFSGCKCKKGCGTRRCKCIKEGKKCGPGCRCLLCTNVNRVKVPELP